VAVPKVGVSTPLAFREWDARQGSLAGAPRRPEEAGGDAAAGLEAGSAPGLTHSPANDTLDELSLAYFSAFALSAIGGVELGTSGTVGDPVPMGISGVERRDRHDNLAQNTLLTLVRTGIENDFEEVVFPHYPSLRDIKRLLMGEDSGEPALYAALSGSGSALFGLYRSEGDARAAQQRVQSSGTEAILTETLTRAEFWSRMFADRI